MAGTRLPAYTASQERIGNVVIRILSTLNVWIFRMSGGRLGAKFRGGAPVLLLTTKGRKSGEPRTAPVLYLRDAERIVVVASKGGFSRHPAWYLNLAQDPNVEIEIGAERRPMQARRASAQEKAAIWPKLTAMYRDFDDYQARTERDIPVVVLEEKARP